MESKIQSKIPIWKLRKQHQEEMEAIMLETGSTFRNWKGKAFWELAKECGHTSLDFNECECCSN